MSHRNKILNVVCLFLTGCCGLTPLCAQPDSVTDAAEVQGAVLAATQATNERLTSLKDAGANAVAIELRGETREAREAQTQAAQRVRQAGLKLYYWIEIGRCPELADAHPRWMASLQGHQQWRRLFPDFPKPKTDEVVKVYPWTPVGYEEAFQAHLQRVAQLLRGRPTANGVFLNDLQGAPSACGCGNPLCRWTTDYGEIRTATLLGEDAAADFVAAVKNLTPKTTRVIPVWTTECEEHDGAKDGWCAGVGCFKGICWKAYTAQLMPLVQQNDRLGALVLFRELKRDLTVYGETAAWISQAILSYQTMPPLHHGQAVPASRLICILQGWDVTADEIATQIRLTQDAGTAGYFVSYLKVDQSWEPRIISTTAGTPPK